MNSSQDLKSLLPKVNSDPLNLEIKLGDLLEEIKLPYTFWVQQLSATGCLTKKDGSLQVEGLAKYTDMKYPIKCYRKKDNDKNAVSQVGKIEIDSPNIYLFGQLNVGGLKEWNVINYLNFKWIDGVQSSIQNGFIKYRQGDTIENRELWFSDGLKELEIWCHDKENINICFPGWIGCCLAKGDWMTYRKKIVDFAKNNSHIQVTIIYMASKHYDAIKAEKKAAAQ